MGRPFFGVSCNFILRISFYKRNNRFCFQGGYALVYDFFQKTNRILLPYMEGNAIKIGV